MGELGQAGQLGRVASPSISAGQARRWQSPLSTGGRAAAGDTRRPTLRRASCPSSPPSDRHLLPPPASRRCPSRTTPRSSAGSSCPSRRPVRALATCAPFGVCQPRRRSRADRSVAFNTPPRQSPDLAPLIKTSTRPLQSRGRGAPQIYGPTGSPTARTSCVPLEFGREGGTAVRPARGAVDRPA